VDGRRVKGGQRLRPGERVEMVLAAPQPLDCAAEDLPLEVVFEDDAIVVINKAPGVVVHPAAGHPRGTLVNALLHHCGETLQGVGATLRPGIVHRLDKETSGVMVVAKSDAAHQVLSAAFADHHLERAYLALCHAPKLADQGRFDTLHGRHPQDRKRFSTQVPRGRRAVTDYVVLERFVDGAALVRCRLETGRTHQVRVHLSEHQAPLLGDALYGSRESARSPLIERVALHAYLLAFAHPLHGQWLRFEQPPPTDFQHALQALRQGEAWRRGQR